jgi:hypothetical protein
VDLLNKRSTLETGPQGWGSTNRALPCSAPRLSEETKKPELHRYWTARDRAANFRLFRLVSEVVRAIEAGVFHPLVGWHCYVSLPVAAEDRARLEELYRYLLRPPVAQDRLRLTSDGRVLLALKSPWADGTSHLLFEPLELLEKLAALIP